MTYVRVAAVLFALLAFGPAFSQSTPASKPNIVFVLMDNLGYGEVGVYGGGVVRGAPTPRIDRLAGEGLRLTNFNVEAQCTPSRSAILTGRFAIRSGTHSVPLPGTPEGLTQWEATIAELLSGAGYATAHFGKWHLGSSQGRLPNTLNRCSASSLDDTRTSCLDGKWQKRCPADGSRGPKQLNM